MSRDDLRGFWNPDEQTRESIKRGRKKKWSRKARRKFLKAQKRKRKRVKGRSRHAELCNMSSEHFYWTKEWRALRRRVLEEYGYRCMLCGSVDQIQVDHIQPRSKAPHLSLNFGNMQVLCKDCNFEKSNIHAEDYRDKAATEELDREVWLAAVEMGL